MKTVSLTVLGAGEWGAPYLSCKPLLWMGRSDVEREWRRKSEKCVFVSVTERGKGEKIRQQTVYWDRYLAVTCHFCQFHKVSLSFSHPHIYMHTYSHSPICKKSSYTEIYMHTCQTSLLRPSWLWPPLSYDPKIVNGYIPLSKSHLCYDFLPNPIYDQQFMLYYEVASWKKFKYNLKWTASGRPLILYNNFLQNHVK